MPGVRRNTRTGRPLSSRSAMIPEELSRDRLVVTLNAAAVGTAEGSNSCSACGINDPLTELANCATNAGDNDRLTTTQPGAEPGACTLTDRATIHRSSVKVATWDGGVAADRKSTRLN